MKLTKGNITKAINMFNKTYPKRHPNHVFAWRGTPVSARRFFALCIMAEKKFKLGWF
jgi:hypothetical protein